MQDFVHLHVHTYYSILDGQSSVQKLVDKAVADGMKGMAITDHGNMFGIKEFYNYCKKINGKLTAEGKEPFKPIFGCEMYVARRKKEDKEKDKGDMGGNHLIVLAKNYHGYKNLIKLVSRAWVDGYYMRPRTDHADLEKYHEDLIVCSACIAGEVPSKILKGDIEGARKTIEWYHRVFGDDYYLEIQRHRVTDPHQRANRETYPLQVRANKVIMELAEEYGIKVVCTNDAHFVDEENAEAHDHLLCLSTGKDLDDPNRMLYSKQEWFKTREEMNAVFSDVPEAMSNTLEILDKVETYSIDHAPIMPFFPIPEEFGTEEDVRRKYTEKQLYDEFTTDENGENPLSPEEGEKKIKRLGGYEKLYRIKFEADYLAKLAYDGAKRLYGDPLPEDVAERVKFELHIMKTMGFPGYFLIVQDFINSARDKLGVMVGPGRGSAAGSVVAYCLGITQIDPIKYDLLFERFLNPDRISLPDIDVDFDDDGRGRVLNWVTEKYGQEKVAHIITYGTMATKLAIKDVARVQKLPLSESDRLCKLVPDKIPDKKLNLPNAIAYVPELQAAEVSSDPVLRDTIKYAKMLEGNVRNTGVHACGTIICRDDITDWVPVSTADDKETGEKMLVTQYEGSVIEDTGLIKMDFLGLRTLSIIKDAVTNVKNVHGIDVDIDNIPLDDAPTYEVFSRGDTTGLFQFESPGMKKHLRNLKPNRFEDLIAMNALYRPGPMEYIPNFIARKHGLEPVTYDIADMEEYLSDTYGITVYQEQVMLLSRLLADFTRGESDALRKAMGKKLRDKLDHMKPKFIEGCSKRGHDAKICEKIWGDWEAFASYAFNKSHSTCYAYIAYQTGYLKAHYPSEFMAALLSRNLSDIKQITLYMNECKRMGIRVLGPDINESLNNFSSNKEGDVRFGLAAVKGVGEAAVESIVAERNKNGKFKDIYDFFERVNYTAVNRKCLENIAYAGGFDSISGFHRCKFFGTDLRDSSSTTFIEQLVRYGQRFQSEKDNAQQSLFGGGEGVVDIQHPVIPACQDWSTLETLGKEREMIGLYLSAHPLDDYAVIIRNMCKTQLSDLDNLESLRGQEIAVAGMVIATQNLVTKTGKPWGKFTLEDYNGTHEFALFSKDYENFRKYLFNDYFLFIRGKVQPKPYNDKELEFKITSMVQLSEMRDTMIKEMYIQLAIEDITREMIEELTHRIKESEGSTTLRVNVYDRDAQVSVNMFSKRHKVSLTSNLVSFLEDNEIKYTIV
mgnify:CR=1 FL=1